MLTQPTLAQLNQRLRDIRVSKNLSLNDVEKLSKGSLKAVVLGSYERGARSLTIKRALAIAEIYGVPFSQLFSSDDSTEITSSNRVVIDIKRLAACYEKRTTTDGNIEVVYRYTKSIVESRRDWNGEVISLRENDLKTIAFALNITSIEVKSYLEQENLTLKIR